MSAPGNSNITTQASLLTRVKVWVESLPIVTRSTLFLCGAIYVGGALLGFDDVGAICVNAPLVVEHFQVYRLVTSAFFHGGLLHFAMNMLAFVPIGSSLERHYGSMRFAWLILLLIFFGDAVYIVLSYALALISGQANKFLGSCALGLSGVIFGLIVVDNTVSGAQQRSIFGLFSVPAKLYPWALLVFWQLLVPGVSFLGHLGGVLGGEAHVRGWFRLITPSSSTIQGVETWSIMGPLMRLSSYIADRGSVGSLPTSYPPGSRGRPGVAPPGPGPGPSGLSGFMTGGWLRVPSADPGSQPSSNQAAPGGGQGGEDSGSGPFKGRGHTLGSGVLPTASGPSAGVDAAAAAAAAAEARLTARSGGAAGPADVGREGSASPGPGTRGGRRA